MSDLPDIDIDAERPDFERNALSRGLSVDRNDTGSYLMAVTEYRWRGWKARARLAAELEREMAAEIRQLHENLKYQRLRNASADDQFHAIAKYFGGKDATNVETGEKTIAGLVRQECDRLKDLLRRCLPHVEVYGNLRAEIEAVLAKREERG